MSLKLPPFKVLLELCSFLIQMVLGLLILGLSLPFIIGKIIIEEMWDNCKIYFTILSQSNFIKSLKTKK